MGVQRIPNGSLHYASGTLETLSHDPACKSFRETERERERDGEERYICKLVEQVNVRGG